MNILIIIYGIIGIFLILEKRLIRTLVYFILLILLLSIYLSTYARIGISYFSYNLIIIEIGAVSILFGIILLIIPYTIKYNKYNLVLNIITVISFLIILYPYYINFNPFSFPSSILINHEFNLVNELGKEFFTNSIFLYNLILISIFLLIPIIGIFTILKYKYHLSEFVPHNKRS